MKRVILYISCILLGGAVTASAQGTSVAQDPYSGKEGASSVGNKVYTLQDCLMEGLENNYSLKIEKNSQRISDNNATLGNAGFLPALSASGMYSGSAQDNETKLRDTREIVKENGIFNQTIDAGVNLNWTIFQGFNVMTTYKKLKELQAQGELETRIAIENLVADITAEYYNYIQQSIRLKNLKYAVGLSRERLRIVEQRYRIGNFSGLDYQQAKVDFNSDSSAFMRQQEALQSSAISLNRLLSRAELNVPMAVADTSINVMVSLSSDDLMKSMLENNATLQNAQINSNIAKLNYRISASQTYPYLRMNAGYGYTLNKYNKGTNLQRGSMGADFGLTLGLNIFDGGNLRRERKNARINIENAQLQLSDVEQSVKSDFYDIWQAYQSNLQILSLEKENLVTARLNHEIAMERYMLGDLSGIEMREAQKSLLDAEERLLSASYNTKLCEISLMLISGRVQEYLQ